MHRLLMVSLACAGCNAGSLDTVQPDEGSGPVPDATSRADGGTAPGEGQSGADLGQSASDASADIGHDSGAPDVGPPLTPYLITGESGGTLRSFAFDANTGQLSALDTDTSASRLTFAAFHPDLDVVYTTTGSTVRAYDFDPVTGGLAFRGAAASADDGTHLEVDRTGQYLFTVSYGGHSLSMLPLVAGTPADSTVDLGGDGDPGFCQNAHQVRVHPSNDWVYVPCLGSDFVRILALNAAAGTIESIGTAAVPAGSGPRHMDFHPTMDIAYVVNERSSTVSVFSVNTATGALESIDTVSTLPDGVTAGSASSDIRVSPDGDHLYAVNRQPRHEVAVFDIDGTAIVSAQHISGMGEHARSFAIDATGGYLLMGNRYTDNVVTFSRDAQSGELTFVREQTDFPGEPMFVGFLYR